MPLEYNNGNWAVVVVTMCGHGSKMHELYQALQVSQNDTDAAGADPTETAMVQFLGRWRRLHLRGLLQTSLLFVRDVNRRAI